MGRARVVRALVACALSLAPSCAWRADDAHLRYPGPVGSSDVARGRGRYEVVCVPCHGDHELRRGPRLTNQRWTPSRIRQRVREGTSLMPAIPSHRLRDDDLEALLAYFLTTGVCVPAEEDAAVTEARP